MRTGRGADKSGFRLGSGAGKGAISGADIWAGIRPEYSNMATKQYGNRTIISAVERADIRADIRAIRAFKAAITQTDNGADNGAEIWAGIRAGKRTMIRAGIRADIRFGILSIIFSINFLSVSYYYCVCKSKPDPKRISERRYDLATSTAFETKAFDSYLERA